MNKLPNAIKRSLRNLLIDIIDEILYFVSVKTIIALYRSKVMLLTYKKLMIKLNDKIGIDVDSYDLKKIEYMVSIEYQIFLFTSLGKMYHTGFGFDGKYALELNFDEYDENLSEFIKEFADDGEEDDHGLVYFMNNYIKRLAKMIIPIGKLF